MPAPKVHSAGPPKDGQQHCTRCGLLLLDLTNSAYLLADGPPRFWPEGPLTVAPGNPTYFEAGAAQDVPLCTALPA